MRSLAVVGACVASCVVYALVFMFVAKRPMTVGVIGDYLEVKHSRLASLDSPKFVLLAGSNGRFSHRCEVMEDSLSMPGVNMSIAATLSMKYQLEKMKPVLDKGDVMYLPLEFSAYSDTLEIGEIPYVVAYDRNYLLGMSFTERLKAVFYFDLSFLLSSAGEMALSAVGVSRRFSTSTLTVQGDEKGHSLEKAEKYASYREGLGWKVPTFPPDRQDTIGMSILVEFMEWANQKGVTVVGGLPTTFDDTLLSRASVQQLRDFYHRNGHSFLELSSLSQYPRSNFYDTPYHLSEPFQIEHSKAIARKLSDLLLEIRESSS